MTEQPGSWRGLLLSMTSELSQSVFLVMIVVRRGSRPKLSEFYLTMMTQVSVSSDQETSTRVWPAPVWWISASFLAVTVCGREEQLVRPDTRYISGKHPLSDNSELLELVKLHTNKQVLQYNMYQETVETLTYQN